MSIDDWIAAQPGSLVTLSAEALGLTPQEFHDEMELIDAAGGGAGYYVVLVHRPSQGSPKLIDRVIVQKN